MTNPLVSRREIVKEAPMVHGVDDKEFIGIFTAGDTTPSVLNLKKFKAVNVAPVSVTYFDDGFDGKEISILGDGFMSVVYDVNKLVTNTGAGKLLAALKIYRFTRHDSIWVEDA